MKNSLIRSRSSYGKIFGVSIIALFMTMAAIAVVLFATPAEANGGPPGMVSYWTLDDAHYSDPTVYDQVGSNHGTNYGATTGLTGMINECFDFDGVDDYVEIGDEPEFGSDLDYLTLEAWINVDDFAASGENNRIINKDDGSSIDNYQLLCDGNNIQFGVRLDGSWHQLIGNTDLSTNTWYHVVATYNQDELQLYINGDSDGTLDVPDGAPAWSDGEPLYIGGNVPDNNQYFDGVLDEVAIYNVALSDTEIENHYYYGLAGFGYCDEPITAVKWSQLPDLEPTGMDIDATAYITQITDDNKNFGSRDNEVVAFPITSGLTLNELFAGDGLLYTYTVIDVGPVYNGDAPVIAVIDLDDGRHIALFPGWGARLGTYTLQFSDTIAHDTGGNNFVDFVIHDSNWIRFWSSNNQYGNWNYLKASGSSTGGPLPLTGTEVVTRVAIQHQAANTGETDRIDSLTFDGITYDFATPQILADDFQCIMTGPITDIHIWGSWLWDYLPSGEDPMAVAFTLSIHADIPDPDGKGPEYSMPGDLLWMWVFGPGEFDVDIYAEGPEGYYIPCTGEYYPSADFICWRYDFYIDPVEAFEQQEGNIYWLDVQAWPMDPAARFGWKTSVDHWNDDAVWAIGMEEEHGPWNELRYPEGHPYCPESIDLAFELTTLDTPPEQYIELGTPIIEGVYNAGGEWLDLIGTQTPVWINSTDPESGTDYIEYTLFWSDHFGDWVEYATYTVYDNQVGDTDGTIGRISIEIYFDFSSCFHEIHAICFNNIGLSDTDSLDFLVDADAPANDEFAYVGPLYIKDNVRYISHRTVKRIWANDTGCTEGVAGVCRIEWEVEDADNIEIANGIVFDDGTTIFDDGRVTVSGDLDLTPGKMVIEISVLEDCEHYIYHQAFDCLENYDLRKKEYNRVDTQPPITTKTFIGPTYHEDLNGDKDFDDLGEEHFWLRDKDTLVILNSVDTQIPCAVGVDYLHIELWLDVGCTGSYVQVWSKDIYDGDTGTDPDTNAAVGEVQYKFQIDEDCCHKIVWFAVDLLGNTEQTHEQEHKVDSQPPVTVKTFIGDTYGNYWVTTSTQLTLTATDQTDQCAVGVNYIHYEIWHDTNNDGTVDTKITDETVHDDSVTFSFTEECLHEIRWYAVDLLGNTETEQTQQHRVDDTPPETIKTFREITYGDYGENYWLRDHVTVVELTATDYEPCAVGVDYIHIELRKASDGYIIDTLVWTVDVVGNYYEFTIDEDCLHEIRWYAVDYLGNTEDTHIQQHRVDSIPPVTVKTVVGPKYPASEPDITTFNLVGDQITNFWIMDKVTVIHLDATDYEYPCDVGVEEIHYRIGKDVDDSNDVEGDEMDTWIIVAGSHVDFTIDEDCLHKIEWFAVDYLGNPETTHIQYHKVDSQPPDTIKTFSGPTYPPEGEEANFWLRDKDTWVILNSVDTQIPCAVGVDYLHVELWWDSDNDDTIDTMLWSRDIDDQDEDLVNYIIHDYDRDIGKIQYKFQIDEDCLHEIRWYAVDKLGNREPVMNIQQHRVDSQPPVIKKSVGNPSIEDPDNPGTWWVTTYTEINLSAYDELYPCAVGVKELKYKIEFPAGVWTDWIDYTGNFTFNEGSVHNLSVIAIDYLGNTAYDNETFVVHGPGGSNDPQIEITYPGYGSTQNDGILEVVIDASDIETSWPNLDVKLWISGGRRDAPDLIYDVIAGDGPNEYVSDVPIYCYQDGAQITLWALAIDGDGDIEFAVPVTFYVNTTILWDQWMQNGWNRLTLPFGSIACDDSVESVLASINNGNFDFAFHYDGSSWSSWVYGEPANTLNHMSTGKEYWIHIAGEGMRFYTDTQCPEVEIIEPEEEYEERCLDDAPEYLEFRAYDIETEITMVYTSIYDHSGLYWDGDNWQGSLVWLECDYDEFWEYHSEGIWEVGHTYDISAYAVDAAGCSSEEDEATLVITCPP